MGMEWFGFGRRKSISVTINLILMNAFRDMLILTPKHCHQISKPVFKKSIHRKIVEG